MKKYDKLWVDINNLLSKLRTDVDVIDDYYRKFGNTAPGALYREYYIPALQKHLNDAK